METYFNCGRFTENQAVTIVKQIAQAVTHLHVNMVHCDVKPENLLFESDSLDSPLKLTDFGLARLITSDSEDVVQIIKCRGFYIYFPPEVLRGEKVDKPCDMWALGCTVYLLLTGFIPFNIYTGDGVEPGTHGECTFPDIYWSHNSPGAKDLIRRLLKTNPKERMSIDEVCAHPWITGIE